MSGDEPYRWSKGLQLTPGEYVKLGQVMAALGPKVTELANEPLAPEHRQLTEPELSDLVEAYSEASRESEPVSYDLVNDSLERFTRVHDQVNALELARQAEPMPVRAEDRVKHLLDRVRPAPGGYSLASQGGITGMATCGPVVPGTDYCSNTTHEAGCGSSGDPAAAEALKPQMRQIAERPYADANGRIWADRQHNAPMSLIDHAEASLGIRLGDKSLFETGKARREVVQARRTPVYGDPDTPGSGQRFSASTMRTAQALADASRGMLSTSADVARQQAAYKAQHARLAARNGKPRHADYADLSNPVHRDTRLVPVGNSVLGSLVPYAAAGTVSGGDEVLV